MDGWRDGGMEGWRDGRMDGVDITKQITIKKSTNISA